MFRRPVNAPFVAGGPLRLLAARFSPCSPWGPHSSGLNWEIVSSRVVQQRWLYRPTAPAEPDVRPWRPPCCWRWPPSQEVQVLLPVLRWRTGKGSRGAVGRRSCGAWAARQRRVTRPLRWACFLDAYSDSWSPTSTTWTLAVLLVQNWRKACPRASDIRVWRGNPSSFYSSTTTFCFGFECLLSSLLKVDLPAKESNTLKSRNIGYIPTQYSQGRYKVFMRENKAK